MRAPFHALPALLLFVASAAAQRPGESGATGTLAGIVVDSVGAPLARVEVLVRGTGAAAHTRDDGTFRLVGIPAGPQLLQLRRVGLDPVVHPLTIAPGPNPEVEVRMDPMVLSLAPIRVRAERTFGRVGGSTFAERRRMGFGTFLSPEDIERRRPVRAADLLRGARGLRLEPAPYNRVRIVSTRGPTSINRPCVTALYLDGVPMAQDVINTLPVSHVLAVEAYPGPTSTPMEFGGTRAGCGVVAIWTR